MVVQLSSVRRAFLQADAEAHFGNNPIIFVADFDCRMLAQLAGSHVIGHVREREGGFSHRHLYIFDIDTAFIPQVGSVVSNIKEVPGHASSLSNLTGNRVRKFAGDGLVPRTCSQTPEHAESPRIHQDTQATVILPEIADLLKFSADALILARSAPCGHGA
jgi:hypothetical protein